MKISLKDGSKLKSIQRFFSEESLFSLFWLATVIFFIICIIFPLICVFCTPRISDFYSVLSSRRWHEAIRNTILECIFSTFFSVFLGYVYAYAVERTNIPFKRFFSLIPIIHLITPPFVGGLSFILLAGRQGFITKTILHLDVSLYGLSGLVIAQTLCFFPVAYLICKQTIAGINPNLEQAAKSMGASRSKIFFTITLPLSSSGIISAFLFIAVSVLSDFGNPMIVAGRFKVLAVEIYTQLTGWLNSGTSAVLGMILVLPSVVLFLLQTKFAEKNTKKIATIGEKSLPIALDKTSKIETIFFTVFCTFISILILAQFISIIAGAFQKLWGINTSFTTEHIKAMNRYIPELLNTLQFALISSLIGTLIASFSAYCVRRTNAPLKKLFDICSCIPSAVPGTLFGLAFSIAAAKLSLRAPRLLITIAMTIGFMPFSYRVISSSYEQIKTNLDDGARALGANRMYVLYSITAPLSAKAFFAAFIYSFIRGAGTLSAVIFLVSFNTPLASISILNLAEQGDWGKSAALALVLTGTIFIILGIAYFTFQKISQKPWRPHEQ